MVRPFNGEVESLGENGKDMLQGLVFKSGGNRKAAQRWIADRYMRVISIVQRCNQLFEWCFLTIEFLRPVIGVKTGCGCFFDESGIVQADGYFVVSTEQDIF